MIITLPKDIIQVRRMHSKKKINAFIFSSKNRRIFVPWEVRDAFPNLGCDMFVSPKEKSLYLTFGKREETQFRVNQRNGYVGCVQLFEWFRNANVAVFEDYQYSDYQIDKKNKIVKVKIERK